MTQDVNSHTGATNLVSQVFGLFVNFVEGREIFHQVFQVEIIILLFHLASSCQGQKGEHWRRDRERVRGRKRRRRRMGDGGGRRRRRRGQESHS